MILSRKDILYVDTSLMFCYLKINGNRACVAINPPMKNPLTASNDGHCMFASPVIPCPEVQPFAQRVPNPTRKPPTVSNNMVGHVNNAFQLKSEAGASPLISAIPSFAKSVTVSGDICTEFSARSKLPPIQPPMTSPQTIKMSHSPSFRQSYFRYSILLGYTAAQTWRRLLDMPKTLPPRMSSRGTVRPINGPLTYHGQGAKSSSMWKSV